VKDDEVQLKMTFFFFFFGDEQLSCDVRSGRKETINSTIRRREGEGNKWMELGLQQMKGDQD
jgi:hypothetical protein